jgi:hypothetical protein
MGGIDEDLDRRVGLLHIAQEAGIELTRNGEKLRMKQVVDDRGDPHLAFRILENNKADVLGIMEDSKSVRQWLLDARREMTAMHNKINETMDRWINVERMYIALNPDDEGCLCRDGCPGDQIVRCVWCAGNSA